jgi:hypothetical protein
MAAGSGTGAAAIGGRGARVGAGGGGDAGVSAGTDASASRRTAKTAAQTAHRARTPASGTFAGSTRYTVAQFGQVTFIYSSSSLVPEG